MSRADHGPVRFIVICCPRTGSNLLTWSLLEHASVDMFGEIFHETEEEAESSLPPHIPCYRKGGSAAEYLETAIFSTDVTSRAQARGFKIFYDHARADAAARTAWDFLVEDPEIRVIHLVRENLFDARASLEVALRTGEWFREITAAFAAPPVAPFEMDPWDCMDFFARTTVWRQWAAKAFASHPILWLDYDRDIRGDFPGAMQRVFDFLDVESVQVTPLLVKQQKIKPSEQVSNYDELREWFKHSIFRSYFWPVGQEA